MKLEISDVDKLAREIWHRGHTYAKAKADRIYLTEYRKTKKAMLYSAAPDGTVAEKESFAYAHEDYKEVLDGIREAVELEEKARWELVALQAKIDLARTMESTRRSEIKAYVG